MFPRLYNKRLKLIVPIVIISLCLLISVHNVWLTNVDQTLLEADALNLVKYSQFNPRTMTNEILRFANGEDTPIADKDGIFFHWDDWVDLYPANSLLDPLKEPNSECQCDQNMINFASVNGYFLESYHKKVMRGMANVFCTKPIPKKVIITTDDSFIEIPVTAKKRFGSSLDKLSDSQLKSQVLSSLSSLNSSKTSFKSYNQRHLQKSIDMTADDFYFDPNYEILKLTQRKQSFPLSPEDEEYLQFLNSANRLVENSDRYFKYPWIITDVVQGNSHHLAYPFFKRFIGIRERQSVIQHMTRAWFQFAELIDIPTWVNYGSLLGWSYNGINMPWDTDVDIQLPIRSLDYLSRHFNQSLVLENPKFGNAKYLLEVSPTYIRQGNGRNFIDARFIDINSGLYIDISALSHTSFQPPKEMVDSMDESHPSTLVHCKHFNWHSLEEILPIRHTYFEGASVYIPHNVTSILTRKYTKDSYTTKLRFMNYNYQKDINLWVSDEYCDASPQINRFTDNSKMSLTMAGACDSPLLQDEYHINHLFGERHLMLNQDLDNPIDYSIEDLDDLPLTRKDPFDYYNDISNGIVHHGRWYKEEGEDI